jgi:hypothetical protein
MILIDEYDHFANNIFGQGKQHFAQLVKTEGFLRPFFETLKVGTESVIDRIVITGVLPILRDSLTSGFNIIKNKSTDKKYNALYGFKQENIDEILKNINAEEHKELVKTYYNGYVFSSQATEKMYNSDMALFFATEYDSEEKKLPMSLIDYNVISDYTKIKSIIKIANEEIEKEVLEEIIFNEQIETTEIKDGIILSKESLELFTRESIITLLYYIGYLTLEPTKSLTKIKLVIPNYAMKSLYLEYMKYMFEKRGTIKLETTEKQEALEDLAHGKIEPYITMIEKYLEGLSNRDYQRFDEKYIKVVMMTSLSPNNVYKMISEKEEGQKYNDLMILSNRKEIKSYIIELKYLKATSTEEEFNVKKEEGLKQIKYYKENTDYENTDYYLIMFKKDKCVEMVKV